MSRVRLLKPDTFKDEDLAQVSMAARLLFMGLWTIADREGRLEDRPRRIKADLFPYEPTLDVESMLSELAGPKPFIVRYSADGCKYIQLTNFLKHQKPHPREAPSSIPRPSNAKVIQGEPKADQGAASRSVSVSDSDSDSVIPPPAREADPPPAECQTAADELVKALKRAKDVTGLDGAEILGSSKVRGKTVIVNPTVCSPAALKLWQVTTERVYGFIAAWEADRREANERRTKPGKSGGAPSWDRGDQAEADLTDQAIAWVDANWPADSRPETRADLEGLLAALDPPASLNGPILVHLLFGRYPDLRSAPLAPAGTRPERKGQTAVTVSKRPTACPECGVKIVEEQPGSYRCADSDGLGCAWRAVVENQPAEQSA